MPPELSPTSIDHPDASFDGFCLESGAARSANGLHQWRALRSILAVTSNIGAENSKIAFGKRMCISAETVQVTIHLSYGLKMRLHTAIVPLDVPFLVWLVVLRDN